MRRAAFVLVIAVAACAGGHKDPCVDFTCPAPAAPTCDGNTLVAQQAGTCSDDNGAPSCAYGDQRTDCTASSQICMAGACVDPCAGFACTTPPDSSCMDGTLMAYVDPGTCTAPGGVPTCTYQLVTTDCAAMDKACDFVSSQCVDPCTPNPCTSPPADTCTSDTLQQHPNPGTCTSPAGVPQCGYTSTMQDCTTIDRVCQGGACVDPCIGVTCTTPPAATCTGAGNLVARTYGASGTCSSPGGVTECDYTPTDKDCALSGQGCAAGACTGPVLFVRVQSPDSIVDVPTTTKTVYGRIYVQGVTDQSGVNDPNPNVTVQCGTGAGADPTAFTYTPATPNAAYGPGSPGYEMNNDEWQADVVVPAGAGTVIHYAFRLSNDGGTTWIYGDTGNAGSSDGFTLPGVIDIAAPYLSEYIEGSSNNKAIELYNPGSIAFSLTGCFVDVYHTGSTTAVSTAITGTTIPAGGTFVYCHSSYALADVAACQQLTSKADWNGNDAVQLRCGTTVYDILGQIGNDPGTAGWGTAPTSTTDHTLLRQCTVFAGDMVGTDTFIPASQWAGYPTDTHHLGSRDCPLP